MQREYKYIVIGAGASGLMFASLLKDKKEALIIDSNAKIGAKVSISGGGKCNITNRFVSADNYKPNTKFTNVILNSFDNVQTIDWFAQKGLVLELRKDNQYFCKNSAEEVNKIFAKEIKDVTLSMNTIVTSVEKIENKFKIYTNRGWFLSKCLVVASGGLSYPKLGASSIGYEIAKDFGHSIETTAASLVGFTLQPDQFFMKELSGSSVETSVSVGKKNFKGNLLFAHKGISGPVILNASLYWQKANITINFIPSIEWKKFKNSNKILSTILPLPKRVAKTFLSQLKIDDKPVSKLNDEEWRSLKSLERYTFAPAGTFGYSKAEVTRGGISTDEIDVDTMMSKYVDDLYFIGEVLNVTGELGGYNLQWAFSSAHKCAINIL